MAKPGIAAAAMFQLFYAWNDYYGPLLYTSENESAWTLSLGLASERRGRVRHPGPLAAGGDPAAGPPPITGAALLALDALDATPSVSGRLWQAVAAAAPAQPGAGPYGPLQPADANGIRLPAGFRSRVVARSGQLVAGTSYRWHGAPDGGACFPDGTGWIYVSNSELDAGAGGASAIRFRATGAVRSAYRIWPARPATAPAALRRGTAGCAARRPPAATSTRPTRTAAPRSGAPRWAASCTRPRPATRSAASST